METKWLDIWRDLAILNNKNFEARGDLPIRYKEHAKKQSERFDPLLDFVLKNTNRNTTALDIGAGSGRWTVPLASTCKIVTAIEPSVDMREILGQNIGAAGLTNVRIVPDPWEEALIGQHDISVCAHAMYSNPDLASFIHKLELHTRKTCYLAIRLPPVNGIIGDLSFAIYGRYHDSPNAIIAYNALYELGICANVLVENEIYRWENNTYEDAFSRAKHHLHLNLTDKYDTLVKETLRRRLIRADNSLMWPDGMRSALLWWNPR
jgi:SAM-dependent methyltransferase